MQLLIERRRDPVWQGRNVPSIESGKCKEGEECQPEVEWRLRFVEFHGQIDHPKRNREYDRNENEHDHGREDRELLRPGQKKIVLPWSQSR
jgi:hypothetical protein